MARLSQTMTRSLSTRKARPRFFERTLLFLLWCGALGSLYLYRHAPLTLFTTRELAGGDVASTAESYSSEFAQTRLFTELPPVEPFATQLSKLHARVLKHHDFRLVLEYVVEDHLPPPPMPPKFEYYSTEPVLPLAGEVFHTAYGQPAPCILFTWTPMPVKDVKYILEIGKSRQFKFFRSFGAYTNRMQLRASKNADYFWRVRATHKGQASVSPPARFNVVVPPDLTPDGKRRELASRVQTPDAWLADVQICP